MSQAFPQFDYYPSAAERFKPSELPCDVCKQPRGWIFAGVHFGGDDSIDRICPWCIADGSAARAGRFFNTTRPLARPLDRSASLPPDEQRIIEQCTPNFHTWQEHLWVMCCGHACTFLGEADTPDLQPGGRWAGAVPSIVEDTYKLGWNDHGRDELIKHIKRGAGPCAYIFQCRVCNGLRGYWDVH